MGANTRVDFRLEVGAASIWVEVKAVSWCVGAGLGQFPDAVSVRARKHVQELDDLKFRLQAGLSEDNLVLGTFLRH